MTKWSDVLADSEYQALPDDQKTVVKQRYFDKVISQDSEFKALPEAERSGLKTRFFGVPANTEVLPTSVTAPQQPASGSPYGGGLPPSNQFLGFPSSDTHPVPSVQGNEQSISQGIQPSTSDRIFSLSQGYAPKTDILSRQKQRLLESGMPSKEVKDIGRPLDLEDARKIGIKSYLDLNPENAFLNVTGEAFGLPAKYLLEKPVSAVFGAKSYEDLASKKLGTGPLQSMAIGAAARIASNTAFWMGLGEVIGKNPASYTFNDPDWTKMQAQARAIFNSGNPNSVEDIIDFIITYPEATGAGLDFVKKAMPDQYDFLKEQLRIIEESVNPQGGEAQVQPLAPVPQDLPPQVSNTEQITLPEEPVSTVLPPQVSKTGQTTIYDPITPAAPGASEAMSKFEQAQTEAQKTAGKINEMVKPKNKAPVSPSIPPWEMSLEELNQAREQSRLDEKNIENEILGNRAQEYKRLQRTADTAYDSKKADEAYSKLEEMRNSLTQQQRDKLDGVGESGYTPDDYHDYIQALSGLDNTSPRGLGESLKYAVSRIGNGYDPEAMSHEQQVAYSQLREAKKIIDDKGFDSKEVSKYAIQAASSRFSNEDVRFVLDRFLNPQNVAPTSYPSPVPEPTKAITQVVQEKPVSEAVKSESTPNQRKMSHILKGNAGISDSEYRSMASSITGVDSIAKMDKGQANQFLKSLAERVRAKQDKVIESPLYSSEAKGKALQAKIEADSFSISVEVPPPSPKAISDLKSSGDDNLPPKAKIGKMPDVFKDDLKEANVWGLRHIRPIRHEFERNALAYYEGYKPMTAGISALETAKVSIMEELAKLKKGLSEKELEEITRFRENLPGAPEQLNLKQSALNEFYQSWYDRFFDLNKVGEKAGYVKNYSPRIQQITLEDKMLEQAYGKKAPPLSISEWYKNRRTGNLEDTELDSSKLFQRYMNVALKSYYLGDSVSHIRNNVIPKLPHNMANLMDRWVSRNLGYPSPEDLSLVATLNNLPGIKKLNLSPDDMLDFSNFMINTSYSATLGFRLKPALRNLMQPIVTTVPEVGYTWLMSGMADFMTHGWGEAKREGVIDQEYAPELYKELGMNRSKSSKLTSASMALFGETEKITRAITYNAGKNKFNFFLKGFKKSGDVDHFMIRLEADKMQKFTAHDIREALKLGNIEEAKKIYLHAIDAKTMYLYNKENAPIITDNVAGRAAMQYKTWTVNYAELMKDWAENKHWQAGARLALLMALVGYASQNLSKKPAQELKKQFGVGPLAGVQGIADVTPPILEPLLPAVGMVFAPIAGYDPFLQNRKTRRAMSKKGEAALRAMWSNYVPGGLAYKEYKEYYEALK